MGKLFAELYGFVIYNPDLRDRYLFENQIPITDVLRVFTETEHGDSVIQEGIAIPIVNIPEGYYDFTLTADERAYYLSESKGWSVKITTGVLRVIGIGYLNDLSLIDNHRKVDFRLPSGWYELSIHSFQHKGNEGETSDRGFYLDFHPVKIQPIPSGELGFDFGFKYSEELC